MEHSFERARADGRPEEDTRVRIFLIMAVFSGVFACLALGAAHAALFAPRGLPPAVMSRLREGMQQAMADKDMRAQLQAQGVELAGTPERQVTPDELAAVLKQDIAKWAQIVKTSGATVN